jgi:hypothetical protein
METLDSPRTEDSIAGFNRQSIRHIYSRHSSNYFIITRQDFINYKYYPTKLLDKWIICYYNVAKWHLKNAGTGSMIIRTRVFDIANGKFQNLSELAKAMGISVSQVYRVREGKRGINEKFIVGAKMAFPDLRLDELFYLNNDHSPRKLIETSANSRYQHVVERFNSADVR